MRLAEGSSRAASIRRAVRRAKDYPPRPLRIDRWNLLAASATLVLMAGACGAPSSSQQPVARTAATAAAAAASTNDASASDASTKTLSPGRLMDPARVAKLGEVVASLRGHPFKKALPPVRFVPRAELPKIDGEGGPLTKVQVQGRYFDDRHEIIIADDFETSPEVEPIIVHELVHALLSDHGVHAPVVSKTPDGLGTFGRLALMEGDANVVEAGFRAQRDGRPPHRMMASLTRIHAPWLPMVCRSEVDSTSCALANAIYEEGRVFASALYRVGGTALLDAAYKTPPTTSLEILYPDLYLAGIKEQPLEDLDAALTAANIGKKAREHAGVFRLARTFAADAEAELLRTTFHALRGDALASLEKGGQLILTEWGDDTSAARLAGLLGAQPSKTPTSLIGPRRLLIGINVKKELVDSVAKHVSAKPSSAAPAPPFGRTIAPGPATWEEELATGLREGGLKGFRLIGIDTGKNVRSAGPPGTSHLWLFGKEKVFLLPTTAPVLTRRLLIQTVEKAWSDPVEGMNDPELPEERHMPIGTVRLSTTPIRTPSLLFIAIARVPVCGDEAAALLALQFGDDPSVKSSLAKNLETLKPTADRERTASLCKRLAADAGELTPPSFSTGR